MRKVLMQLLIFSLAVLFGTMGFATEKTAGYGEFKADLSGKTNARGEATFQLSKDGNALSYKVTAENLSEVTGAHIHLGKKGENGPPVAPLSVEADRDGGSSGTLAQGTIRESDLMGPMKGKPLSALLDAIKSGDAYVNIHTSQHKAGEIRGQIE